MTSATSLNKGVADVDLAAGRETGPEGLLLINVAKLDREYHDRKPDMGMPDQRVAFGTSRHRGTPGDGTFTEAHVLAITQAICDYRPAHDITGPLFMGKDTHALSAAAQRTALEVLAANAVETVIQRDDGVTPTPVISRVILVHNLGKTSGIADGIVITPSHNPPGDGGFKYNPPNGGPADTDVTKWIQDRANELLLGNNAGVKRVPLASALRTATHAPDRLRPPVRRRPSQRYPHGSDPRGEAETWRRPARRGSRRVLGPDQ